MTRASPRSHPPASAERASPRAPAARGICRYVVQEPRHADDLHHLRVARAALGAHRRRPRRSVTRSDVEGSGEPRYRPVMPTFGDIVERSLALLQRRGRVSHTALRLEFGLDDATFAALRQELVAVLGAAGDEDGVLVARAGVPAAPAASDAAPTAPGPAPAPTRGGRGRPRHQRAALRPRRVRAAGGARRRGPRRRRRPLPRDLRRGRAPAQRPRAALGLRRRRDLLRPPAGAGRRRAARRALRLGDPAHARGGVRRHRARVRRAPRRAPGDRHRTGRRRRR